MMIRRKLFAYTVMFTAGITAGFFIFERARLLAGTLFIVSLAAIIYAIGRDEMRVLAVFLIAGLMVFTVRYVVYGTCLRTPSDNALSAGHAGEPDAAAEIPAIEGFAESVSVKNGRMRITLSDTDVTRYGVKVLVTVKSTDGEGDNDIGPSEVIGSRIRAYGMLQEASGADNPGCFDYSLHLRSRGTGYLFSAKYIETDIPGSAWENNQLNGNDNGSLWGDSLRGRYLKFLYSSREGFLDQFDDEDTRAFIKGTVFGDKSGISEDITEDFNINGTGHILAVSGLHTGFLYSMLRLLMRRRRTALTTAITIAALVMYGDMTMWSPSAVRAVTVLIVSMMSIYTRRPFDLLSAVSAAAMLMLLREPYQLFSAGFQMSFLALLGIAFLSEPLSALAGEALAVPVAVQTGILPVTAYIYHRINLLSVFINIPVISLASVLVPVCMSLLMINTGAMLLKGAGDLLFNTAGHAAGAGGLYSGLVHIVITAAQDLTELLIRLNSTVSAGGYFSGMTVSANAGVILLFYLAVFLISSEWMRINMLRHDAGRVRSAAAGILAVSALFACASFNLFSDDELVFVSVGQGDCTHIRAGGKDVLIDGGGDTERNVGKDVLMPYLLSNGAERTELALVTHLHADHYKGIYELNEVYPVGKVGIPEDYRQSIESITSGAGSEWQGSIHTGDRADPDNTISKTPDNVLYIREGDRITVADDVYIDPVWPLRGAANNISIEDPNENNMVYIVNYRGVKTMVTGDLLEVDELEMIRHYSGTDTLDCDILKVGHHGSKTSSSEAFLDAVSPEIAVISVGRNNLYGHPHEQTLSRLEDRGIRVYRTDLNGAVGIDIRSSGLKVDIMRR